MKSIGLLRGMVFGLSSVILANSVYAQTSIYNSLTPEQKELIQQGEQVKFFTAIQGEIWPKAEVLQRVDATPKEAMAVMADYALQRKYVNRVKSSVPRDTSDPSVKVVDYKMDLPFFVRAFFSPKYTVKSKVISLGSDTYEMEWDLIGAGSLKRFEGRAQVEPLPGGSSIIYYTNILAPASNSSVLKHSKVIGRMKDGVTEALESIVQQIEQEKAKQFDLLQKQIEALQIMLE